MFPNFISRANSKAFRTFGEPLINDYMMSPPTLNSNPFFTYGLARWKQVGGYESILTDNGNGTIHIEAVDGYGGIEPDGLGSLPNGSYIVAVKVANVTGNGKLSYKDASGGWHDVMTFSSDYDGTAIINDYIDKFNLNGANDPNFSCDADHFLVQVYHENRIPKMTGTTTPYGVCSASTTLNNTYPAWKAFNQTNSGTYDTWISTGKTATGWDGDWLDWRFDEATPMVPTVVNIWPRNGMSSSYYAERNPRLMEFYVVKPDDSLVKVGELDAGTWTNNYKRTYNFSTTESGIGFRMLIKTTQNSVETDYFHTAIGRMDVYGHIP